MRYNGGKGGCAKEIASIINSLAPSRYWEPFVGAGNVIQHVSSNKRLGSDLEQCMISLFKSLQNGWVPPTIITEEEYKQAKCLEDTNPLKAFIKYGCSFGGKPWGGYARSGDRNYALNAYNSLLKQLPFIKDVYFHHAAYDEIDWDADVIYCDPPYKNTTSCGATKNSKDFDTDLFFDWCRHQTAVVLITELSAPDDFVEIWSKQMPDGLGKTKIKERLFIHKSQVCRLG
jgi:DNA adenine methylase